MTRAQPLPSRSSASPALSKCCASVLPGRLPPWAPFSPLLPSGRFTLFIQQIFIGHLLHTRICGSSCCPIVDHVYIRPRLCLLDCEHFDNRCHVGESPPSNEPSRRSIPHRHPCLSTNPRNSALPSAPPIVSHLAATWSPVRCHCSLSLLGPSFMPHSLTSMGMVPPRARGEAGIPGLTHSFSRPLASLPISPSSSFLCPFPHLLLQLSHLPTGSVLPVLVCSWVNFCKQLSL